MGMGRVAETEMRSLLAGGRTARIGASQAKVEIASLPMWGMLGKEMRSRLN
jgi:hypothetical protein